MNKWYLRKLVKEEVKNVILESGITISRGELDNIADYNDGSDDTTASNSRLGYNIPQENRSHRYLFTVPNTPEGRERIKRAKEALSQFFKFQLQGRHNNRKEILGTSWKAGTPNNVPVARAQYLAVYVDPK